MAASTKRQPLPAPAWIDEHPSKWPVAAQAAMELMATAAERRLAAENVQTPKPPLPAPEWIDQHPSMWPTGVKTLYGVLANIAERRLAARNGQSHQVEVAVRPLSDFDPPDDRVAMQTRQYHAALESGYQRGPVPGPELLRFNNEADGELMPKWRMIVRALPAELRPVVELADDGLSLADIADAACLSHQEVWDRALLAHAEVLRLANMPVVNHWLEASLRDAGLWPLQNMVFTGDVGAIITRLAPNRRCAVYALMDCSSRADTEAIWGLDRFWLSEHTQHVKRVLRVQTIGWGFVPYPVHEPLARWETACGLGVSTVDFDAATADAGITTSGTYSEGAFRQVWSIATYHFGLKITNPIMHHSAIRSPKSKRTA